MTVCGVGAGPRGNVARKAHRGRCDAGLRKRPSRGAAWGRSEGEVTK
jgi:hypothetical protein